MTTALLAEEPRARLRRSLLRRYGADADFGAALEALYRDHCEALPAELARREPDGMRDAIAAHYGETLAAPSTRPVFSTMEIGAIRALTWRDLLPAELTRPERSLAEWAGDYLAGVRSVAETFGLHRIDPCDDQRPFSTGETMVHGWCQARAQYGPDVDASWIVLCVMPWAGFLPPREQTITVRWDPRIEVREDAQRRAFGQVREALTAVDAAWRDAGLDRDRGSEEARHLDWLDAKVRHGWSYQEIAHLWHRESQADDAAREAARAMVQRAVIRAAEAVGIDRTGW